jgi:HlyD family secretion protein
MRISLLQLIFFLLCSTFLFACKKKQESTSPEIKDVTESVYASGKIKAKEQYFVFSTVTGILKKIFVKPGDSIKSGQVLFLLDDISSELAQNNAKLTLELSLENSKENSDKLQELELNRNIALQKLQLDSSLYFKQKHLWAQKIGTEVEYEQRELAYKTSKSTYEISNSIFLQTKRQLVNETKRASNNYTLTQKQKSDYSIKSALNGAVYDILKDEGELITPQTAIAVIGLSKQFELELEVDEKDIARIKIGQSLEITMDSYKGKVFQGAISSIYPIMNERTRTFKVMAQFINKPPVLYPNLSIETNIIIHTKKNALIIPVEYLLNDSTVILEDTKNKVIKTGLRNYTYVEILDGLTMKNVILKPTSK